MHSIETVFEAFKALYPQYDMFLASGIPSDIGKISDVDIAILAYDHNNLSDMFNGFLVDHGIKWTTYSTIFMGREVNVYATQSTELFCRGIIHRQHESLLARNFPKVLERVIALKRQGAKTEPAWTEVLQLGDVDPYEAMLKLQWKRAQDVENNL